jgi:hypothetical protein
MTRTCRKFEKLLIIELESLEEELELLVLTLDKRLADHEITDYVRNENCAVLRNEILGLRNFLHGGCFESEADNLTSIDDAAECAKRAVRSRLQERGYVPALYPLVERRIDKIASYMLLDTELV